MWPTVVASNGGSNSNSPSVKHKGHGEMLVGAVKKWPTPTVRGNHNRKGASKTSANGLSTEMKQSGMFFAEAADLEKADGLLPPNPDFAEWLMNWPESWTRIGSIHPGEWERWIDAIKSGSLFGDVVLIKCKDEKIRATRRGLCGMAANVPNRTDRLSAIGDGQVPAVVAFAWHTLTKDL